MASFGHGRGSVMGDGKISYAGIGAAVAGSSASSASTRIGGNPTSSTFNGTADISGQLGLGMAIGLFAMGGAYVLIADPQIRRVTGALATLFAVLLTLSCVWGLLRHRRHRADRERRHGAVRLGPRRRARDRGRLLVMRDSAQSEAAEAMPNASMAPDAPEADTT
jgi:hypothetical protein